MAAQARRATTATPDGTGTTSVTPGTRRAAEASNDFTVAPNRGGRAITAVSMSGRRTSCVYTAEPLVLARESTRGAWRPISLKSFGSFSVTWAGGVWRGRIGRQLAERGPAARSPRARARPASTVISPAGTFHSLCRRRDQHGARGGAGPAELLPGVGDGRAAAGALHGAPGQVVVARDVDGRRLDADLRPVGVELLGQDGGQSGMRALSDLEVLGDDGDGIVRRDPHEGVGREHSVRRRVALSGRPARRRPITSPIPATAPLTEELAAARHHKVFAASWMAARMRT